jgi:hypothetical protein
VCCRFYKTPEWGSCWSISSFLCSVLYSTENYWLIITNFTQVLCRTYNTLHRKRLIDQREPHVRVDQSVVFCVVCCRFYKVPEWGSCWSISSFLCSVLYILQSTWVSFVLQHTTQKTTDWSTRTSLRCFVESTTHYTENDWLINTNRTQVLCRTYNTLHRKRFVLINQSFSV